MCKNFVMKRVKGFSIVDLCACVYREAEEVKQ